MDYLGGSDHKRSKRYEPGAARRRATDNPPPDAKAPPQSARIRNGAGTTLRLLFIGSVLTPSVMVAFIGTLIWVFGESSESKQLARILFGGAIINGMFAWTQAIARELERRADLRIQIGFANDLRRADLVEVDASGVFLRGRKLSGARLSRSRMHGGDFSGAELIDTRLTKGKFFGSNFDDSQMVAIGGYGADFRNCTFVGANLTRAILTKANLRDCDFTNANLTGADLRAADLSGSTIAADTILVDCWYDETTTIWPDDFDHNRKMLMRGFSEVTYDKADEVIDLNLLVEEALPGTLATEW